MDGFLLINKPKGWTSHDVVGKVRSLLRQGGISKPKVGHTGTLDPLATGLMLVVIGDYTKRAQEFSKLDKTYEVTLKLGETSTTGDDEGAKTKISARKPAKDVVRAAVEHFIGKIEQVPPAFSAIKVDGQRAYKLARDGKEVKLQPRRVKIYQITDVAYAYPNMAFTAEVSTGTYIRSLVEDIGKTLGTGAYMSALSRVAVGRYVLRNAQTLDTLTYERIQKYINTLP